MKARTLIAAALKELSTSTRGLASLSPERRREIAAMGGKAAAAKGTAHRWTSEAARAAGLKSWTARRLRHLAAAVVSETT